MDPCLKKMLTQTVTVASPTGVSSSGTPTLGPKRTMLAYVELARDERGIPFGTEEGSTHRVWLCEEVNMEDCFWLPDMDVENDSARSPQAIDRFYEPMSTVISHWEVVI